MKNNTDPTRERANNIVKKMFGFSEANNVYLFFRDGMFYPLELSDDESAIANAKCNPGTTRVEDAFNRRIVWPVQSQN